MAPTRAVVVAILAAASLGGWWLGHNGPGAQFDEAVVIKVDDGDTIVVRIGTRTDTIRFLGIDTPETHHPTKPVGCYGPEASDYTTARLSGRPSGSRTMSSRATSTTVAWRTSTSTVIASTTSCSSRATRAC